MRSGFFTKKTTRFPRNIYSLQQNCTEARMHTRNVWNVYMERRDCCNTQPPTDHYTPPPPDRHIKKQAGGYGQERLMHMRKVRKDVTPATHNHPRTIIRPPPPPHKKQLQQNKKSWAIILFCRLVFQQLCVPIKRCGMVVEGVVWGAEYWLIKALDIARDRLGSLKICN